MSKEPRPPENVCLLNKSTGHRIPLDGVYTGRNSSGVHIWEYLSPIAFDPDEHTVTIDLLPAQTAIRLTIAQGMISGR